MKRILALVALTLAFGVGCDRDVGEDRMVPEVEPREEAGGEVQELYEPEGEEVELYEQEPGVEDEGVQREPLDGAEVGTFAQNDTTLGESQTDTSVGGDGAVTQEESGQLEQPDQQMDQMEPAEPDYGQAEQEPITQPGEYDHMETGRTPGALTEEERREREGEAVEEFGAEEGVGEEGPTEGIDQSPATQPESQVSEEPFLQDIIPGEQGAEEEQPVMEEPGIEGEEDTLRQDLSEEERGALPAEEVTADTTGVCPLEPGEHAWGLRQDLAYSVFGRDCYGELEDPAEYTLHENIPEEIKTRLRSGRFPATQDKWTCPIKSWEHAWGLRQDMAYSVTGEDCYGSDVSPIKGIIDAFTEDDQ